MPIVELPSPTQLKTKYFLEPEDLLWIESCRNEIKEITAGLCPKKILITGPCSIHDASGALCFADHILKLQELLPDWRIVMRAHLEKPRTSVGWKGFVYDPYRHPFTSPRPGLSEGRELLVKLIKKRIPLSYELLDPFLYPYFEDCYAMGQIGTRTIRSSIHRQLAAASAFAIGLKNPQDGQMEDLIHAFRSIESSQDFYGLDSDGRLAYLHAEGNPHQFVILRGTDQGPNFSEKQIHSHLNIFGKFRFEPHFVIDCGHGNSQKSLFVQKNNALEVLQQMTDPRQRIVGLMVESYLKEGSQGPYERDPGLSITDPCLGIDSLFSLFEEAKEKALISI